MAWPGHIPQGRVDDHLLSHYDFFPTLLDLLALNDPALAALPGRSFAPLLRDQPFAERQAVVVFDEYGPVRMIRSRTHKYVHRFPYGPHEFFDLALDPGERENRIADPAYQQLIFEMKAALDRFFLHYADPDLDGARQGVTGKGQLERVGTANPGQPAFSGDWWYVDADGVRRS